MVWTREVEMLDTITDEQLMAEPHKRYAMLDKALAAACQRCAHGELGRRITEKVSKCMREHTRTCRGRELLQLLGIARESRGGPRAALEGHADTVRSLAVCGSNVNAADEKGATALHKAAAGGHIETIEQLLSLGADAHAHDATGRTALHYAAQRGHLECARLLVRARADRAKKINQGQTALELARGEVIASQAFD